MLRRGPGTPREEVIANQRERLFGAMVASVANRGYEATRVADLAEISGVSSRSFYDHFADKRACFLATMEAIIEASLQFAALTANQPADWEQRARRGFEDFATMIVAQPAASRMCLVDAYAAGPEAVALLERATASFEALTMEKLAQSPERAAMPAEMVTAHTGAMQEIARTRIRRAEEARLPGLMAELWSLIFAYRPPPEPLRPVRHAAQPVAPVEAPGGADHAERVLTALASLVAEQGYARTTIDQVVKRASMSATTFYAQFESKEDALMAALDSGAAQLLAAVMPAFRRAPDWPHGIRAAFGALFGFLASRPDLARLIAVEVYAAGPNAIERRTETLKPLEALFAEGHELSSGPPPIAVEAIAGGLHTLAYQRIRDVGPHALPGLTPICTYIALSPFVGPEQACEVANSSGSGRSTARRS